jgi:hypothetical protein
MKNFFDQERVYKKYLIIDCHCPSGSVCFRSDYQDRKFTYDIDRALCFDTYNDAETYIKEHSNIMLCPSIVDYRVAQGIARELSQTHVFKSGNHAGEYIC